MHFFRSLMLAVVLIAAMSARGEETSYSRSQLAAAEAVVKHVIGRVNAQTVHPQFYLSFPDRTDPSDAFLRRLAGLKVKVGKLSDAPQPDSLGIYSGDRGVRISIQRIDPIKGSTAMVEVWVNPGPKTMWGSEFTLKKKFLGRWKVAGEKPTVIS
jgi:hypothetical protein